MLQDICTKPCATTAHSPKQGPIKDLGPLKLDPPHSTNFPQKKFLGGQSNPGLPFTLMDREKDRSGESINEYIWLNEHQHISVNNDKNMMKTLRKSAETETEVSPFLSFPNKQ